MHIVCYSCHLGGAGCLPEGLCLSEVVSAWRGMSPYLPHTQRQTAPLDPEADTPLRTEFLTHTCENITFADGKNQL